jgi:High potential iron-sulfur protein
MSNRRAFLVQSGLAGGALFVPAAFAQAGMVSDSDPQASALGYHGDANKTDKAKFPKYAAGQQCGNCALFQGKAGEKAGLCPLFAGKQVSASGWCSAYNKKA